MLKLKLPVSINKTWQVENLLLCMSRLARAGLFQPKVDWCDLNDVVFSAIKRTMNNGRNNHKIQFYLPKEKYAG